MQGWTCVSVWGATQFVTHGCGSDVRRLSQRQEQQAAVLSELTSSRSHGWGVGALADALRQRPVNETRMNLGAAHWQLVTIIMLVAATGCSPSPAPPLVTTSEPTPAGKPPTDYVALEAEIEKAITTGPATLDKFGLC